MTRAACRLLRCCGNAVHVRLEELSPSTLKEGCSCLHYPHKHLSSLLYPTNARTRRAPGSQLPVSFFSCGAARCTRATRAWPSRREARTCSCGTCAACPCAGWRGGRAGFRAGGDCNHGAIQPREGSGLREGTAAVHFHVCKGREGRHYHYTPFLGEKLTLLPPAAVPLASHQATSFLPPPPPGPRLPARTRRTSQTTSAHRMPTRDVSFAPHDDYRIVSGGDDCKLCFWDTRCG